MRGWLCRKRYIKIKNTVCGLQRYSRAFIARQRYKIMLDNYKATQIQRFCRGYLARMAYKKKLRDIIKCQALIRSFLARRLYKRMKAEARTISHIQKMYKGLENKIISLQQRIDELTKENNLLKTKNLEISDLRYVFSCYLMVFCSIFLFFFIKTFEFYKICFSFIFEKFFSNRQKLELKKNLENELKLLRIELNDKDQLLKKITKQLEVERDEKMVLLDEKIREETLWNEQKKQWRLENEELKRQVDEMIDMTKKEQSRKIFLYH